MVNQLDPVQHAFVSKFVTKIPEVDGATEGAAAAFQRVWTPAYRDWQNASGGLDQQISALQAALKSSEDPELKEIGELGLNAITGNHRVKMMAALLDIDGAKAAPTKALVTNAAAAIKNLEAHLASDPRIAACDNNPFGVPVTIAKSMTAALGGVKSALRAGLQAAS